MQFPSVYIALAPTALVMTLLCTLGVSPAHADEIYKSVDAQGNVTYSDRGTTKSAQKTSLKVAEPDPAEVARLAKEQALLKAEDAARKKQEGTQESRCQSARNRYFTARDSARLYRWDASGNKIYYSATEADLLRSDARRAMVAACGGG